MKASSKTTILMLAAAMALSAVPAWAFQPTGERIGPASGIPAVELRILEHEQRMLRDQEQHRLNLEQDRNVLRYRPDEVRIPKVGRTCRLQIHGNKWLQTCS